MSLPHRYIYIMTQDSRLDPFIFIRVLQVPKIDHDTTITAIFHDYNLLYRYSPILRCNKALPLCDGTGEPHIFQKAGEVAKERVSNHTLPGTR
jgi:hypothetical protein